MDARHAMHLHGREVSVKDFVDLTNHVVLPPKLPQSEDANPTTIHWNMLRLLQDVLTTFELGSSSCWASVSRMLAALDSAGQPEKLRDDVLDSQMAALQPNDCLALYLPTQNAAVLLLRKSFATITVESFEISAPNAKVMSTTGRLRRTFPSRAVVCSTRKFFDKPFRTQLRSAFHRLASERPPEYYKPTTRKAQNTLHEERDTTHPGFVNDYLMTILGVIGQDEDALATEKCIRDDVLWQNTRYPWRRAPFWLFLKVAILRVLLVALDSNEAQKQYKLFMIHVMARLVQLAAQAHVEADLLSVLHVKLARRVFKFEKAFEKITASRLLDISREARQALLATWTRQIEDHVTTEPLPVTGWEESTSLTLLNARLALAEALSPLPSSTHSSSFVPESPTRISQTSNQLPSLKSFHPTRDLTTVLADVESWVEAHLATWTGRMLRATDEQACDELAALIESYWGYASTQHQCSPLEKSNALLIVMELWVALDKLCLSKIRILHSYSPEIPVVALQPLLLSKAGQIRRLSAVESHISQRLSRASLRDHSVFATPTSASFCVHYFNESPVLQQLRSTIEQSDEERREDRARELERAMTEHNKLLTEIQRMQCEWRWNRNGKHVHVKHRCQRCRKQKYADSMRIAYVERSLPNDEIKKKAAVFELGIPKSFAAWRDATWLIINDIGQRQSDRSSTMNKTLLEYEQLREYVSRTTRITLGSSTKSHLNSHYRDRSLPTTIDDLCINNGLTYDVWDNKKRKWLTWPEVAPSFKEHCTLSLPQGPYANLDWAMRTTEHTSNQAISKQSECDKRLEVAEFLAFCELRAGERIQWMNLLRELGCSNLDHTNPAVTTLILQAIWEAGTPSDHFRREAHAQLSDSAFCQKLLALLQRRLTAVENNWDKQYSMMSLIQLALRLLSLTLSPGVEQGCLDFLRKARGVCLNWCHQLELRVHESQDTVQKEAVDRLLIAALLCYSTFDIDDRHLSHFLASEEDIACAVEAQIFVYDTVPVDRQSIPELIRQSLLRHEKIAHKLEPRIRALLLTAGVGLTKAVQHILNGALLQSEWKSVSADSPSWVRNETVTESGGRAQLVHYNLLGGDLLVDGKPVGKVSENIKTQPLFLQVFGSAVLHVFSSDMPGMTYRVSQHIHENEVHIGMREGRAVIKARANGRVFQALPRSTFSGVLPRNFVESFHHWIDEETGDIEFRPGDSPWQSSSKNWKMSFSSLDFTSAVAHLRLNQKRLVEQNSAIGRAVTRVLGVLDNAAHCHIKLDDSKPSELEVELPRYNLHFAVTGDGNLVSLEFNAVVDTDQGIGTLVGLQNRLVLRVAIAADCPQERKVVIPYGKVDVTRTQSHVKVAIRHGEDSKRRHFVYSLDRHLGKLRGAQDTIGLLYKAYLHAVTSFPLPDPFTGLTGTEEAIEVLKSASLFTSALLKDDEFQLLETIAALTPSREFYPKGKRVMQTVTWDPVLPSLSQHDDFLQAAQSIAEHHNKAGLAYGQGASKPRMLYRGDQFLLERARKRNSSVLKSGLVSSVSDTTDDDSVYNDQRNSEENTRAQQVYEIADLVANWPSRLSTHTDLASVFKGWQEVSGYNVPFDIDHVTLHTLTTLQVPSHWGSLYELCRSAHQGTMTYPLIFAFCAIALGAKAEDLVHLRTLLAFAFSGTFRAMNPPATWQSYTLNRGSEPSESEILGAVGTHVMEPVLPADATFEEYRAYAQEMEKVKSQVEEFSKKILDKWPAEKPTPPEGSYCYIRTFPARLACEALFAEWHKNRLFLGHLEPVNAQLATMRGAHATRAKPQPGLRHHPRAHVPCQLPTLGSLLADNTREVSSGEFEEMGNSAPLSHQPCSQTTSPQEVAELEKLLATISQSACSTSLKYSSELRASFDAFRHQTSDDNSERLPLERKDFELYHASISNQTQTEIDCIRSALAPLSLAESLLRNADLWPRTSKMSLLTQLSNSHVSYLSSNWKSTLLELGESMAYLQRSERMLKLHAVKDFGGLRRELKTPGRQEWSAKEHPSWLLLELENNITIRPLQARVAKEMISPKTERNSVLQLNMGEGKSSVIVPMIVAALADGNRLIRVIVLKPLLRQTEQVLSQRLGGLLNQRVYHVPFSRKTEISAQTLSGIRGIMDDCRKGQGTMIVLPEEILSMKLMTREKMVSDPTLAGSILDLQRFLEAICRDVIDESDEVLGIRSQLIYPVGSQRMLDGKTDRWLIAEGVLRQVRLRATQLAVSFPSSLEVDLNGKYFPSLKFLDSNIFGKLVDLLIKDAIDGQIAGIAFDYFSDETRKAIENFIRLREVPTDNLATINRECSGTLHWNALLILRGLFAHDVLSFVLQRKRWLVEYGLDTSRCLMAVPYQAKGVPTQNSEFGHPDVAVLLTCLSYYYTGLTMTQVEDCFRILLKDTNAQDIYTSWALASQLPANLSSLDAINLDDRNLCQGTLFPSMRFNLETLDFFLNQVVFPREGKEFEKRLSASGWDVPSASEVPELLTTGFSGTNDSRAILPYSIKQRDLEELHHTNAMVLHLLLREENQAYVHGGNLQDKKLTVDELLSLASKHRPLVSVLVDVGAQVLEATNLQLVGKWLVCRPDAQAAVYFDEQDEAMVLDRTGATTPLRISPFYNKLDGCLIYLDEVHTRGIDLAIPMGAHAAVTLGPRLIKDRLVQACMRLRCLGNGHSLCFISPTEVHRSICDMKGCDVSTTFTSFDVLAWCMEQTCQALDISRPLRAMHGLEHLRQQKVMRNFLPASLSSRNVGGDAESMGRFWEQIQENESQKLELLYGIHEERIGAFRRLLDRESGSLVMQHLVTEYDSMNRTVLEDSTMDNEQERELAHEIERQRQVERPPPVKPCPHRVSQGMYTYVESGLFTDLQRCQAVRAFQIFSNTDARDAAKNQQIEGKHFSIWVTSDFRLSVDLPREACLNDYLRSVHWVLSSSGHSHLTVISPFEANQLLPRIKASNNIRLHTFAPRLNKAMVSFNNMDFYTPNRKPTDEPCSESSIGDLDLFAGSLYLENEPQYERLRHFLGLVTQSHRARDVAVNSDGFVSPEIREAVGWPEYCPFSLSPLPFLKQVYVLRRRGQGFAQTHMGHLLDGRALRQDAFQGCDEKVVAEEVEEVERADGG